jgi:hypothetical protein
MRPLKTFWLFPLAIAVLQLLPGKSLAQGAMYLGGAGARALGAGGAFVAIANDVTAGYWNPAGLGEVNEPQLAGMYSLLSLNRQHNYAAAAYPLGSTSAMSISWIGYRFGNVVRRNPFGVVTRNWGSDQNVLLFSYGNQINENFALGGNVKLLFQNLAGVSASGMGFDFGAKLKLSEIVSLGAGLQNMQPQVSWKIVGKGRKALPVNTRAGVNVRPLPFMNLAADFEFNDQQKGKWHAGGEIFLGDRFGLRTGSDGGAFTLGASLMRLAVGNNTLEMDYGFANEASASHRLAFVFKFGNSGFGTAPLSKREKKVKPAAEETDYEKILAAREKENYDLVVEQSASGELATARPDSVQSPERSIFEQLLAEDESEETMAALAPEKESATLPEVNLPAENIRPDDERHEAMAKTVPEQNSAVSELKFDKRIAALEARTSAGGSGNVESVSGETVETTLAPVTTEAAELTFEEKMARLEAQTNAGESVNAGTAFSENVATTSMLLPANDAEPTFEEKIALFEAQTNTGESGGTEPVSNENLETMPAPMTTDAAELTFDDKIARLDAQTSAGESAAAETVHHESVDTPPAPRATDAAEPAFEAKMARLDGQTNPGESVGAPTASNESMGMSPRNGVGAATPPIMYGNKNGLTIPAIAPGKRLGHSVAVLFQAQVIEARPGYWIINLGERAGFNAEMMVEIFEPTPEDEIGRSYGTARPVEVRSLYSVIQITKRRSKRTPAAGEKVILKYLYPAVNY